MKVLSIPVGTKGLARLLAHVGGSNSIMNERQTIATYFQRQYEKSVKEYRERMIALLDYIRFLLCQGLTFRAHDESKDSRNQGNFLELMKFLADHNPNVKSVVLENTTKNLQLISLDFQKEMVKVAAIETTKAIIHENDYDLFAILVDESRDVSCKEQMSLVIQFVQKDESVVERFLGVIHVSDTVATSLKTTVESKLAEHNLCLS
jgi:Domain of unknown function (DUF4371)